MMASKYTNDDVLVLFRIVAFTEAQLRRPLDETQRLSLWRAIVPGIE